MQYRSETIDSRYDLHFGQLAAKTEITYRCDGCRKQSNNELEVRSIYWNRDAFRNFCSTDCANTYAEDKYEKGLIEQVAEHYQVGKSEATDYIELLDKTQCERILTMYGYSDGDKKKLLKGIK